SGGGRLHAWTNLHYLPMRRSPPTSAPFRCPVCGAGAYARAPALGRLVPHAVLLLLRVLGDVRGSGEVCRQAQYRRWRRPLATVAAWRSRRALRWPYTEEFRRGVARQNFG